MLTVIGRDGFTVIKCAYAFLHLEPPSSLVMEPVKLYVYDLSNGMAKSLSRQLTGRQIDGIWYSMESSRTFCGPLHDDRHTSIVVYGKEVFYGQGIAVTAPGRSHVCARLPSNLINIHAGLAWIASPDCRSRRNSDRPGNVPRIHRRIA